MKSLLPVKKIAVFASGNGTNAENVIKYFSVGDKGGEVCLVVCNRPDAFVLRRAAILGVPSVVMSKTQINTPELLLGLMNEYAVDIIVLAGFLLMVPGFLIERYSGRIVNIHPSLLPKFGGKGMYGRYVHEAVVEAGETETGITVHMVSGRYDEGRIIFQARTAVGPCDTASDVESAIHELERQHYARVIDETFCCSNKL